MDPLVLIAILVYLWAGFWISYSAADHLREPGVPAVAAWIAYLVVTLLWAVVFPIAILFNQKKGSTKS